MRILVVIYEFPPIGGGGGMVARDISLGLARRGHEIRVLTAHYQGLARQEELNGVQVLRVPSARQSAYQAGLVSMSGFVLAGLWAGRRLLRQWRPDLMHVHFAVPSGPVAWALSRWSGIPYVLTAHLGDVPEGVPEKTGRWFRWVYPFTPSIWRDAARVAAVSEHTRQLALRHYPVQVQVIPNGVDLSELPLETISVNHPPLIVFAGRFAPQKNPLQLVHTLAELKHLPWHCLMMGDGPLRPEVERAIQSAGLQERFTLPGWVSPEEVLEGFRKADILFMPSLSEGLPVVGVRALALGLAVVAGRVGGFLDLVDVGENGFLIDPENPDGYVQALQELLTSPTRLRAFRCASRRKAQQFDVEQVIEAYETLFRSVLDERNRSNGSPLR
ncbi:MAG: glycosyltransferase family 4 protein [Anaerolineales bacterium]|nr:glycosyltransferase family 4 protein [Anaerolineales bacterium]